VALSKECIDFLIFRNIDWEKGKFFIYLRQNYSAFSKDTK